jgi:hypothetical protein
MTPHLAEQPQQQAREVLRVPDGILDRPRPTAHQVLVNVAGGHGYFDRQVLAVEVVMNEEWWRGYAAALAALAPAPQGDADVVAAGVVEKSRAFLRATAGGLNDLKSRERFYADLQQRIAAAIRATAGDGR